ncbi:hypothetical protein GFS24_13455 [Chitinophaga sp. SYP-B3965]|uniref:hypothetical protein n=1 Tax=Chitinophaga sp. SYP-B3965 TaxID=2663120 RepID=UPI001299D354|nr:hypothetical protein [Chitinophaga sp. SYP-B3965]MRG46130.1 hypothetical protein [Chitinophaga sp. SYP-B3965]
MSNDKTAPLSQDLEQAIKIIKRINANLQMNEKSLQYLENKMLQEYNRPIWDELELNNLRITMYCVVSNMMVCYSSFNDELSKGFAKAAILFNKEQYIDIKKYGQPLLDNINNTFPNLTGIRNTLIAHGYRLKSGIAQTDIEIDRLMNQLANRDSLHSYYSLSNHANLMVRKIEKVFGEVDAELVLETT